MHLASSARRLDHALCAVLTLACACMLNCSEGGSPGGSSQAGIGALIRSSQDTDADGHLDFASVADWDGDGWLEMKDIQDAIDALTDPDGIVVEVGAGEFCPPDPSGTDPLCPDEPIYGTYGLIELPDNAVLRCSPTTLLRGMNPIEYAQSGSQRSVVANRDRVNGNSNITVEGCDIHAGLDAPYDSFAFAQTPSVRGIDLRDTSDVTLINNRIRWSGHAAIYAKNSINLTLAGNTTTDCGGLLDTRTSFRQPCVYMFSDGGAARPTRNVLVTGHFAARARSALYNTRRNAPEDILDQVRFENSTGVDSDRECISLRGGTDTQIVNMLCDDTTGFKTVGTSGGVTAYYSDGVPGSTGALKGLLVDGLTITNSRDTAEGTPFALRSRLEDTQILDVLVDGTFADDACFRVEGPWRNTVVQDIELRRCGAEGIKQISAEGTSFGSTLEERLWIAGLTIDGVDQGNLLDTAYKDAILFQRDNGWVQIENFQISQFTRAGIALPGTHAIERLVLHNGVIDGLPNGYKGRTTLGQIEDCTSEQAGSWYSISDAFVSGQCTGGGTQVADCVCDGAQWVDKLNFSSSSAGLRLDGDVEALEVSSISFVNLLADYAIDASGFLNQAALTNVSAHQPTEPPEAAAPTSGAAFVAGGEGAATHDSIVCEGGNRGSWWTVTDAFAPQNCSSGGGAYTARCICDGTQLQVRSVVGQAITCDEGAFPPDCATGVDPPLEIATPVPSMSLWGALLTLAAIVTTGSLLQRAPRRF